ncbi:hypothetical protein [Rhizobium leguminosarum]|uniref:hypothetical protein n=1 Tax=Rhizobium leguminosarum TaxID=384 RepID=UPI001C9005CD|nr:hypothetical protein [Rhizobium leguminosarum]MBY2918599.1 hypothetical protein [Rhizobium leguminosarum]MBY2974085.1 hypothetical protein [Rhizobium leguminosarum]MBY2981485.1 hypothetical protein [Rhizobium leguminosarum]MBY3001353.1 hypothetical protein [Rhizobium leguminosarum]MBY3010034.1 hypothetical protein [Rhizobium leguminosarum]
METLWKQSPRRRLDNHFGFTASKLKSGSKATKTLPFNQNARHARRIAERFCAIAASAVDLIQVKSACASPGYIYCMLPKMCSGFGITTCIKTKTKSRRMNPIERDAL